jgi:acyl-coenzyme A synthetase/AMP-(fatty) acid ligase
MHVRQRLGAIHSVVFGGFSAKELAVRIQSAKPKIVLAASCGIEPGEENKESPKEKLITMPCRSRCRLQASTR